ncbi:hypothetical protein [Nonomuraea fuscirosea]|uniref:hypothetical protein n=1 Tax=Nonomuraea fuscirosea TaxID=1291556 RepID=UPI00342DC2E9
MGTEPPKDWPGLVADRDGVTYDAKKIENIAGALREALKPIDMMGTGTRPGSLQDLSMVSYTLTALREQLQTVKGWAGGEFGSQLDHSHTEVQKIYQSVLTSLNTAIALVEAGAGTYKVTNAANQGGS